jgi:TRAP-type C4-dicarboxylate transport system permease small subunit
MSKLQEEVVPKHVRLAATVSRIVERISQGSEYFAGGLVIVGACLITLEVVLRTLFKASTMIADQFVCYLYVGSAFFAFANALLSERHIKVTVLTMRLRKKAQVATELFGIIVALAYVWAVEAELIKEVVKNYQAHVTTYALVSIPLWIPQVVMPIGMGIFGIALIVYLGARLNRLRRQQ